MKNGLVSVLVVSYNAERYIEKTLKSCLGQTYKNLEVLILDNASKDGTVAIAKNFQENDSRLKLFESKENLGPYKGLNFLLDKAMGEYIAIQDHDDVWLPEKISKQIKYLERNPSILACGTETFYFYEKRLTLIADRREGLVNFVDHTSLMFRNNGFRYNISYLLADEYFEKIILGGKIYCIPEPLVVHRIRIDKRNYSKTRFLFTLKNLEDFFVISGFNLKSLSTILGIFILKYFPESLVWLIVRIMKRNSKKFSVSEFSRRFGFNLI